MQFREHMLIGIALENKGSNSYRYFSKKIMCMLHGCL